MVTVYWQCSKNTSPGPYFCLYCFETEEDETLDWSSYTATCPRCGNSLSREDYIIEGDT